HHQRVGSWRSPPIVLPQAPGDTIRIRLLGDTGLVPRLAIIGAHLDGGEAEIAAERDTSDRNRSFVEIGAAPWEIDAAHRLDHSSVGPVSLFPVPKPVFIGNFHFG